MPVDTLVQPWSHIIVDQLAESDVPTTAQYAVVHVPLEGNPYIISDGFSATQTGAQIIAEEFANECDGGQVSIVPLADLSAAAEAQEAFETSGEHDDVPEFAREPHDDEDTLTAEIDAHADTLEASVDQELADGTAKGEDPDKGQIFDVPRVTVALDETDPTVLKLSFSGGIELDRAIPSDVQFYNRLKAGSTVDLEISAHVAGAKTTHRRDSDGNVDAIVQTKSLIVHSIDA